MGGGQGHHGDPETAPGGVVPHAGALPDDPTAALAVAAGEGVDDGRPGVFVYGSQHAQHTKAASPGTGSHAVNIDNNCNLCERTVLSNIKG